jgi:hypothetical protein
MVKALPLALLALAACLGAAHAEECEAEEKALMAQILVPMMADGKDGPIQQKIKSCGRRRRLEGSSRRRLADCSSDMQDAFDDAYDCKEDAKMDCASEAFG